jgi:hypothetical protein
LNKVPSRTSCGQPVHFKHFGGNFVPKNESKQRAGCLGSTGTATWPDSTQKFCPAVENTHGMHKKSFRVSLESRVQLDIFIPWMGSRFVRP